MKKPKKIVKDMMSKKLVEGNYVGSQYNTAYIDETKKKKNNNHTN